LIWLLVLLLLPPSSLGTDILNS